MSGLAINQRFIDWSSPRASIFSQSAICVWQEHIRLVQSLARQGSADCLALATQSVWSMPCIHKSERSWAARLTDHKPNGALATCLYSNASPPEFSSEPQRDQSLIVCQFLFLQICPFEELLEKFSLSVPGSREIGEINLNARFDVI
jgi:hypothetical protein